MWQTIVIVIMGSVFIGLVILAWELAKTVVDRQEKIHADLGEWYITHEHPNLPDGGGIWVTWETNPDGALYNFKKGMEQMNIRGAKVRCCTQDYGWACACLLQD